MSRRAFLKRSALLGAAIVVPGGLLAACGGSEDVFTSTSAAAGASTTTTTVVASAAAASYTTSLPETASLSIDFTYEPASGTQVRNPYVAVWIEDGNGELVATVALWLLQSEKGLRWVNELRRWDSVDGSTDTISALSSATRTPGDYSVLWRGVDSEGTAVEPGEYFVCIEAAREHGPYSLIREALTLGDESLQIALPDDGELIDATVTYSV